MKKLFAIITCLFMTVTSWAYDTWVNGLAYNLNYSTHEATVTLDDEDYYYYSGDIVIPSFINVYDDGFTVTGIDGDAFRGDPITSVTIPTSVTSIDPYGFIGCSSLSSIVVKEGNKKYDSRDNCNAIIETNTNTLIVGCKNTTFPNSVTSIGYRAFSGRGNLTSITIPNSVTSIGSDAFNGCSNLTSITIPNSVTSIRYQTFYDCSKLSSITIPNSVTSIEAYAFFRSGLTSVIIGNSIEKIGRYAFSQCRGLTEMTCLANVVPTLENDVFYLSKKGTLYVPKSSVSKYKEDTQWNSSWNEIIGIKEANLNLIDGEDYTNEETEDYEKLTFTKTFSASAAGKWNAFYVPMNVNVEKYVGQLDFAKIYAFCATVDTNGDGIVDGNDENYLFVRPVKTGVLKPNVPYLVRPREAKTYVINSADNKLYPKTDGKVEFSTSRDNFTVTGLNAPFTVTAGDNNYYVSASGTLGYRTSGSTTVKANRWIMHRESKGYGSVNVSPTANSCRIIAIGEDMDETTAIETIKMLNEGNTSNSSVYTLDGRKVNDVKTLSNGIYIKNGKKFIVK